MYFSTKVYLLCWEIVILLVVQGQEQKLIRSNLPAYELALHILFLYHAVVLVNVTGMGSTESLLNSVWQFILRGVKNEDSSIQ